MADPKTFVEKFFHRYDTKLKKLSAPLMEHFGLNRFAYIRMSKDGGFIGLSTPSDYPSYFVSEQHYKDDLFFRSPDQFQSGSLVFSSKIDKVSQRENVLCAHKDQDKLFDYDHTLILLEKKENYVDMFGYFAPESNRYAVNNYFNHLPVFKKFNQYFLEHSQKIIHTMECDKVDILSLKGDAFYQECPFIDAVFNKAPFLKELEKFNEQNKNKLYAALSNRELECVKLYLKGNTAKKTARLLKLSSRTVEHYLDNAKEKMQCRYKRELFEKIELL